MKRATLTQPLIATVWGEKREVCLHGCLDLNGNIHTSSPAAVDPWKGTEAQSCCGKNETALEDFELRSEEGQHRLCQGRRWTWKLMGKYLLGIQVWILFKVYKMH